VGRNGRVRLRRLRDELLRMHPSITDPDETIARGSVLVDRRPVTNPASLVREGAAITLHLDVPLRGEAKLRAALDAFALDVAGRTALDVGAAAGGFTRVLLDAGVRRVYAVDAGHGQLLGSLRQCPSVVNLEGTNLGDLTPELVPETIDVVTLDLTYLALAVAVPQLDTLHLAEPVEAVALVKPQFELGLSRPPTDDEALHAAVDRAAEGFDRAGWRVLDTIRSPVTGGRGATEFLLHAKRGPAVP
jgi:23S rRNA (cytidine1920-2'-O)/16S rRNA (cytidine1409-2'-O)-methyltransferase